MKKIFALLFCFGCTAQSAPATPPVAVTDAGVLRGVRDSSGIYSFRGVRYALPPVDTLRWRAPVPLTTSRDTIAADAFGASCMQPSGGRRFMQHAVMMAGGDTSAVPAVGATSEDCLFLNVWTPDLHAHNPVIVWVHGGGGTDGSGSDPTFNGSTLAGSGVVLVTFNYRLGPFGFLAHPALSSTDARNVSGNYALLDQVAVLRWVRQNIARFGGDPSNVTIAGQSAGASLIGHLMVMPDARGLFERAILQSGTGLDMARPLRGSSPDAGELQGAKLATLMGIPSTLSPAEQARRLRGVPADSILRAAFMNQLVPDGPVVDGVIIPEAPLVAFRDGRQAPVPVIVGSNTHEVATLDFLFEPPPRDSAEWIARIERDYGTAAPAIDSAYRVATNSLEQAATRLNSDAIMAAPAALLAAFVTAHGNKAYLYSFDLPVSNAPAARTVGAFHGAELTHLFGNYPSQWGDGQTDAAGKQLRQYWLRFAATGNPGGTGTATWMPYDSAAPRAMVFSSSFSMQPVPRQIPLFWKTIAPGMHP